MKSCTTEELKTAFALLIIPKETFVMSWEGSDGDMLQRYAKLFVSAVSSKILPDTQL